MMIWPGAEIDEEGRPWEIEGITPGFWIPEWGLERKKKGYL
jgi:hypothetical protein